MSKYTEWAETSLKRARELLNNTQATQSARMIGYAEGYVLGWEDIVFLNDAHLFTEKEIIRRINDTDREGKIANADPTASITECSNHVGRRIALEEALDHLKTVGNHDKHVSSVIDQANAVFWDFDTIVDELRSSLAGYDSQFIDKVSELVAAIHKEVYKLTKMYADNE